MTRTTVVSGHEGGARYSDSIYSGGRTIVEGRKPGGGPGSEVRSDLDAGAGISAPPMTSAALALSP